MSRPALDLSRKHFIHPHIGKSVTVYGTWWREDDGRFRPCIVLVPTNRKIDQRIRPCVVTVDDAFKWDIEDKTLSKKQRKAVHQYMCNAAAVFADNLGLGHTEAGASTVINIVHDHLGDLLTIPPVPPGEVIVVADGFQTDENGKTQHMEITERL